MIHPYSRLPEGSVVRQYVPITRDKTQPIPEDYLNPGYMISPGFRHGEGRRRQTVYLAPEIERAHSLPAGNRLPGLEYADSIGHIMLGAQTERWDEVRVRFNNIRSAEFFEAVLQGTLGDETVVLKHFVTGIDAMTLNTYHDYGYTIGEAIVA